jgi:pyruvoyl-dependent arginine decarboxylase
MHAVSDSTGERSGGVATPAAFGTIVLSTGLGVGPTALAAFDAALLDAGVANYNLICLSSVIPPGSRLERRRFVTPPQEYGQRLYVVMSQMREERPGHTAHAPASAGCRTKRAAAACSSNSTTAITISC